MAALSTPPVFNDRSRMKQEAAQRSLVCSVTTNAATSSTWAHGISGITALAWTGATSADQCAPIESAGTITFNTPAGGATGTLVIWHKA